MSEASLCGLETLEEQGECQMLGAGDGCGPAFMVLIQALTLGEAHPSPCCTSSLLLGELGDGVQ